ncbi:MAG: AMP-binding protein [Gammaproteobacteria bacterium]|nr:AMP-binding protein [Gammaproteobacteria bacterium]
MYNISLKTAYFPAQTDAEIHDITIGNLLRKIAAKYPDAIAVQEIDNSGLNARAYTYAELLTQSEQLALALSSRFQLGEKIVVWAPNQPEWILMEYACALAGLVLVTANPSFQAKELRYVLEQSGAVALFYVAEFRGNPMAGIAGEALARNEHIREQVLLTDQAAMLHQANPDQAATLPMVCPQDAAQIQYTSGTTGFPKGATLSHRNLHNNARLFADRVGVNQQSVWANFMPLFHTAGCATGTLGCLQAGCRMLLIRQFNADSLAELIEREGVTTFFAVPTMLVALLESLAKTPRDMTSMHSITSGGAPVAPDLVRHVKAQLGCHFQSAFGQTESSPMISLNHPDVSLDEICTSAGQPLPQCEVSIRSPEDNSALGIGEVGEICTRSYAVMLGYHANEAATQAAIDTEGWLHTGDWGKLDEKGFIRVTGRLKDMIIRGGENRFPAEIEYVLITHDSVAEVAVVGLPDEKWGEIIAAFVRTENNQPLDDQALHAHCREYLSAQKTPTDWVQVESFPLTGSGKMQKFVLRERYLAREYGEI